MSEYMTVNQAATLLHVSTATVRRWICQGDLKAHKVKTGRRILIDKADLVGLLRPAKHQDISPPVGRRAVVDQILAFRQKHAAEGTSTDTLIDQNRQERERE